MILSLAIVLASLQPYNASHFVRSVSTPRSYIQLGSTCKCGCSHTHISRLKCRRKNKSEDTFWHRLEWSLDEYWKSGMIYIYMVIHWLWWELCSSEGTSICLTCTTMLRIQLERLRPQAICVWSTQLWNLTPITVCPTPQKSSHPSHSEPSLPPRCHRLCGLSSSTLDFDLCFWI